MQDSSPIPIVLAGIGGMGAVYVRELLEKRDDRLFRIAGACDPEPGRCPQLGELEAMGVPFFPSLEGFYAAGRAAALAVISSPIPFHCDQTRLALARGSHVLCEKPAAGTIQEVRAMREAERASGRRVAVGYQWSFSRAIQALKSDILAGRFGRPRRFRCLYLWPRDEAYYRRNDWAGKKRSTDGAWILDSPAQNAMAHDLHNMFYLLGKARDESAKPVEVESELYRANAIENYDTAAARIRTEEGIGLLFLVTHASAGTKGPVLSLEFERGVVRCLSRTSGLWAEFADGTRKDYGLPDEAPMKKLWDAVDGVRSGARPVCGLEAAASQTLCVDAMQDACPEIRDFPRDMLRTREDGGSRRVSVEGLDAALEACYGADALPSELGFGWSARSGFVRLGTHYSFPNDPGKTSGEV